MGKRLAKQEMEERRSIRTRASRRSVRWSWLLGAFGGIVVVALVAFASRSVRATSSPDLQRVVSRKPGVWGELEYTRITIEPPEEYVELKAADAYQPKGWVFQSYSRAQVSELFNSVELTPEQRQALLSKARWEELGDATVVYPDKELILGLSPKARQAIYGVLARYKENLHQTQPFAFRPELLGERLEKSGLSEKTIAGFRSLLYPQGSSLFFADATIYMSTLKDPREQMRFFRTVSRRMTLLVKLKIKPDSNIDQLVGYWDFDGRRKDMRTLFESLARVPGGCSVDLSHLLTTFARKRIYTFPPASNDPLEARRDCHWTALNFFNDPPDDRFCDPETVRQTLDREYEKVTSEWRLGDVLVLFHPGGATLHSAVYLADDLVFTKNGGANTQPWIYMRMQDMLDYYAACSPPDDPPQIVALRRRAR